SARQLVTALFVHIERAEPEIGAFLHLEQQGALAAAQATDIQLAAGEAAGPLAGLPIAVKDNICCKGMPTTCASRMLQGFMPPYDATVIERLKAAGAIVVGKTNMDEFAMGSSCEHSYYQATQNPWDKSRVPGGSSGGSAAAVAAGEVPLALGSDTGGSVRTPASFCGLVGLKPTYGAVSRHGLVAFASSLEQIGPMARTVDDAALFYSVLCGADTRHDATGKPAGFSLPLDAIAALKGKKIAVPKEYFTLGVSAEVAAAVRRALAVMEGLGAHVEEISLPATPHALPVYYVLSSAEASSNLARFDGVKYGHAVNGAEDLRSLYRRSRSEGFGSEVQRRILLGTFVLMKEHFDAYYRRAQRLRREIGAEYAAAFSRYDLLVTPTTPTTAFKRGEKLASPMQMYAADVCTVPANIAGLPALSMPCGLSADGLPIGLQLIGPKFSERRILSAAKAYEAAVGGFATKGVG
ncbi:MAG: Asp-tRNA(Asn)/Glu-tRNA(Gln) amidotransferase subunit GatA, partial [Oscillospiraceae bacterium]